MGSISLRENAPEQFREAMSMWGKTGGPYDSVYVVFGGEGAAKLADSVPE